MLDFNYFVQKFECKVKILPDSMPSENNLIIFSKKLMHLSEQKKYNPINS